MDVRTMIDEEFRQPGSATAEDLPAARLVRRHGPAQGLSDSARHAMEAAAPVQPPAAEDSDLDSEPPSLAGLVRGLKVLLNVGLAAALVLGLFALAQAATLFSQIAFLPGWLQAPAYVLLAAALAVLGYLGLRFAWSYVRLRVSPTLELKMQQDLRIRDLARHELSEEHFAEARRILTVLLGEYPADGRRLRRMGLAPTDCDAIFSAKRHLCGDSAPRQDLEWLGSYQRDFLAVLDAAADRRIRKHLKRVFALTATIPKSGLDTLVVLWISYQMVSDLCGVYNVRAGRWGTALILAHLLINVVAAGEVHDATASAAGSLGDLAHQHLSQATAAVLGAGAKVVGKAAEGGVNTILLWRLSIRTREYLRPIRKTAADVSAQA